MVERGMKPLLTVQAPQSISSLSIQMNQTTVLFLLEQIICLVIVNKNTSNNLYKVKCAGSVDRMGYENNYHRRGCCTYFWLIRDDGMKLQLTLPSLDFDLSF